MFRVEPWTGQQSVKQVDTLLIIQGFLRGFLVTMMALTQGPQGPGLTA